MSQDLSDKNVKKLTGSIFPEATYDAAPGLARIEALITPTVLRKRFLFGIPLVSPLTREKILDPDLIDYITRAASYVEQDAKIEISAVTKRTRLPFDPNLYEKDIWLEVPYKPIQKVITVALVSASYFNTPQENDKYPSGGLIYQIPNEWVDTSYAAKGRVFVNPINPAFAAIGVGQAAASAGASILQFIGLSGFVPAFWTVEAVHGFCTEDGHVPVYLNEAIGTKAAILVLENIYLLFRYTSRSLGIDGMSQSVSDQFPQLILEKIELLKLEYAKCVKTIKTITGNTGFVSNI